MSKTYEGHEEPYNETGHQWSSVPPTNPGLYWLKERDGDVEAARLEGDHWEFIGNDWSATSAHLAEDGTLWWSEKLKEPK